MSTHSSNNQPSTTIADSVVNIDTLNVNKTSTEETILSLLPEYYLVLSDPIPSNFLFTLNFQVNLSLTSLFKVFVDGVLLPSASSISSDGVYLYPNGTQFVVNGISNQNLITQNSLIHALYTKI